MNSKDSTHELTKAITELRNAQARKAELRRTRVFRLGLSLRSFLAAVLPAARRLLIDLRSSLRGADAAAELVPGAEYTLSVKTEPRWRYEVGLNIRSNQMVRRAALLSVRYLSEDGETLEWEQRGFSFSPKWGFFQYVSAYAHDELTRLVVSPPSACDRLEVALVGWSKERMQLQELDICQLDWSEDAQLAWLADWVKGAKQPIRSCHLEVGRQIPDEQSGSKADDGDITVYLTRLQGPPVALSNNAVIVSRTIADEHHRALAALFQHVEHRSFAFDEASFYTVLQVNFFRYEGWDIQRPLRWDDSVQAQYLDAALA